MRHNEGYHRARGGWRPTPRQREVLDAVAEGRTNAEIAVRLGISVDGAKWHVGELLAQTGCEDRQALGRWWREAKAERPTPGLLPLLLARPHLSGGILLATLLLVGLGWWAWSADGDRAEVPLVPQVPGGDEGYLGGGRIRPSEPIFEEFYVELTVEGGAGESRIDLRDLRSGRKLGSVQAGYRPMVLVRQEAQELLVSSGVNPGTPEFRKVLQVYDLRGYSLELERTIEVPDRINCTTYCQPMVLSRDERYVYYAARTTAPECGAGGDASVCDVHAIWAIDLDRPEEARASVELPRGCGVPSLGVSGQSGAIIGCRGQYPVQGGWTQLVGPEGAVRALNLHPSNPSSVFATDSGEVVQVLANGNVAVVSEAGQRRQAPAIPEDLRYGARVYYLGAVALGNDRLFIVLDNSDTGAHDRKYAFVVFDLTSMSIEGYGRVPEADYYLPQGESVYVLRGGRIEVLDLATGNLDMLSDSVGPGVEVLLPGR
jgi:DNA-binding CsgD family transcriptional regulator